MSRRLDYARLFMLLGLLAAVALLGASYPLSSFGGHWLEVTWQQPKWLWGLLVLPLALYYSTLGVDTRTARLRIGTLQSFAGGPRGLRSRLCDLPGVLRVVGLGFCILALARPVSLLRPTVSEEEGIDLIVALDLSGSMEAVMENLPPDLERYVEAKGRGIPPTRLDAAKAVLRDFISRRKSDRMGVVVFGRNAYIVSPPTLDYQLLDALVAQMELKLIDPRGTAIGDALGVSVARLRNSSAKSKAIVLLTDGDNQHGTVAPEYAAHLANKMGVKVFTVQVGEGDLARVFAGYDLFGQPRFERVPYPTNPKLLKKLSELTGGSTYVAKDAKSLQASFHDLLDKLEKTQFEAAQASYADLFRYLLFPGVVLIFLQALLAATWLRRFP
jgi:Ca-activated chloride channel homolog